MFNTYQNIFNQVQVQGVPEWGMDDDGTLMEERIGKPFFSKFMGLFGNAQIGPIYCGNVRGYFLHLFHDLVQHRRLFNAGSGRLVGARTDPPVASGWPLNLRVPEYGLSFPPLNDGGCVHHRRHVLFDRMCDVVVADLQTGATAQDGQTRGLGFCGTVVPDPCAWPVPSHPDGQLVRGGALRHLPAP